MYNLWNERSMQYNDYYDHSADTNEIFTSNNIVKLHVLLVLPVCPHSYTCSRAFTLDSKFSSLLSYFSVANRVITNCSSF